MRAFLIYIVKLFLFWLLFFAATRLVFVLYNLGWSSWSLWPAVERHGLRLDLSMAAYATTGVLVIALLALLFKSKVLMHKILPGLNKTFIIIFSVFLFINMRLYAYWGSHIDVSIFEYLRTPQDAMASVQYTDWVFVLLGSLVTIWFFLYLHRRMLDVKNLDYQRRKYVWLPVVLAAVMVIPIRGGLDVATVGISSAYFSSDNTKNHAALNPVWNALFSLVENKDVVVQHYIEDEQANDSYREMYGDEMAVNTLPFSVNKKTNVVMIVLESFTANVVEGVGGIPDVTPRLNKLIDSSVVFSNFYASGDRSDRGLTTLVTGFPSLTNERLLKYPNKLTNAPNLYRNFKRAGYNTSFYYGGNLEFANLKLLFTEGEVDKVMSKDNLPDDMEQGKWGVRDEDLFELFWADVKEQKQPFFSTVYTLSSHEPFDIPSVGKRFDRPGEKFYQSVYYTDSCLGVFMDKLQQSPLWENTLVVITADHGVRKPEEVVMYSPRKFRIPLVFTGGVVDSAKHYKHYCSHTDLPFTLEQLVLHYKNEDYRFSKSVFDSDKSFAHYYYNLGLGLVNENGCVVFDIIGDYFLVNTTTSEDIFERMRSRVYAQAQLASEQFESY
jgi:phosphoglycerol transferase MdoB-like AlkP superfamily enzyme